jgi:hypothetical protein
MTVTASKLRQDIYNLLDHVLETGEPLEIERKGQLLKVVPEKKPSKLDRLVQRTGVVNGDYESLIDIDWSSEWSPEDTV